MHFLLTPSHKQNRHEFSIQNQDEDWVRKARDLRIRRLRYLKQQRHL